MSLDNMTPVLLSTCIFVVLAICFRTIGNDFVIFRQTRPGITYKGFGFNLPWLTITEENWPAIKRTGFKVCLICGGLHLVFAAILVATTPGDVWTLVMGSVVVFLFAAFMTLVIRTRNM